jgi:hypothetical protein
MMYQSTNTMLIILGHEVFHSHHSPSTSCGRPTAYGSAAAAHAMCALKFHVLMIPDNSATALVAIGLHTRDRCKAYNIGANLLGPAYANRQVVCAQMEA